jgi:N-acetylneuraminic acid mutarotase
VTTTNAPTARVLASAVWTGTEMIIWGGLRAIGSVYLNDGGRYNPSSDSWAALTAPAGPSGRLYHTAVWTDSLMFVNGGWNGVSAFNDAFSYQPPSTMYLYLKP